MPGINPDDVLALVEDGPQFAADLAKWLGVSRKELRPVLRELTSARAIRQLVRDQRWALAGYVPPPRGMNYDRRPSTLAEARAMVAYNQQILETSQSPQRQRRARRMLANLQPVLAQLEARVRPVPGRDRAVIDGRKRIIDGVEYEVVDYEDLLRKTDQDWPSGGGSLSGIPAPLSGHWRT